VSRDDLPSSVADPETMDSAAVPNFKEHKAYVDINGVAIHKPFVEKPVSGEDHNIYIYYHPKDTQNRGSKRLFRKVGNRSSKAYPYITNVRTEGSYIYEEFITTRGTRRVALSPLSRHSSLNKRRDRRDWRAQAAGHEGVRHR